MKTAIEWLLEEWPILESQLPDWLIKQAKEMEKEHIMAAWLVDGYTDISDDEWKKEFEEYYSETYKSE
jgi:hypothetical protein